MECDDLNGSFSLFCAQGATEYRIPLSVDKTIEKKTEYLPTMVYYQKMKKKDIQKKPKSWEGNEVRRRNKKRKK
jgi:hypothetical protein